MTQDELIKFILFQFPIAAALAIAIYRGWIEFGPSVKAKLAEKDKQIEFYAQLRKEALEDKKAVEAGAAKQNEAIGELTNVVRESLQLNNEILGRIEDRGAEWDGVERRRRVARTRSRTSKNPKSTG